jgi:hypothetical protein
LVGDAKAVTFRCRNSGGRGRFRLLAHGDYPAPSSAQRHVASLPLAPFNVTPTEFALGPGDECDLHVDYAPLELGEHRASFVMVCDNCQVDNSILKENSSPQTHAPAPRTHHTLRFSCFVCLSLSLSLSLGWDTHSYLHAKKCPALEL